MPPPSSSSEERVKKTADMAAYRKAYRASYRQNHRRPTLTLTGEEYRAFARQAERSGRTVPQEIKALAEAGLAGRADGQTADPRTQEEAVFLLRNIANNVNQIARRLNLDSRQTGEKVVRDAPSSRAILDQVFASLQAMEQNFPGITKAATSP